MFTYLLWLQSSSKFETRGHKFGYKQSIFVTEKWIDVLSGIFQTRRQNLYILIIFLSDHDYYMID